MSNTEQQQFVGGIAVTLGTAVLTKALNKALDKAMDKAERSPITPVEQKDKAPIKEMVRKEVVQELGPVIENMTNSEPLWRSKVMWTAVGTVIASAAGIYSMMTGDNRALELVAMGTTMATAFGTIYSRVATTKAIGR